MEKATEVYNKLKLRFVGKGEVAAKPGTESKDQEDNGEVKNTGKKNLGFLVLAPHYPQISFQIYFLFCYV